MMTSKVMEVSPRYFGYLRDVDIFGSAGRSVFESIERGDYGDRLFNYLSSSPYWRRIRSNVLSGRCRFHYKVDKCYNDGTVFYNVCFHDGLRKVWFRVFENHDAYKFHYMYNDIIACRDEISEPWKYIPLPSNFEYVCQFVYHHFLYPSIPLCDGLLNDLSSLGLAPVLFHKDRLKEVYNTEGLFESDVFVSNGYRSENDDVTFITNEGDGRFLEFRLGRDDYRLGECHILSMISHHNIEPLSGWDITLRSAFPVRVSLDKLSIPVRNGLLSLREMGVSCVIREKLFPIFPELISYYDRNFPYQVNPTY